MKYRLEIPMANIIEKDDQYLHDFFNHAPVGFHVFGPDRKIMDINQAELDMIGYQRNEIVGKKRWLDLIVPEEKPLFEQHWKTLMMGDKVSHYNYTLKHKSGSLVYVVLYATARFDSNGDIINTRGITIDVTPHKEMEEALKISQKKIRTQQSSFEERSLALNDVLAKVEIEKRKMKQNIYSNMEFCVFPVLTELKRKVTPTDRQKIDLVEENLHQLTSDFGANISDYRLKLTPREIEICNMIKNGLTTKEIANTLSVSLRTVDNHRNHIRKKLNILQEKVSLASYLQSLS